MYDLVTVVLTTGTHLGSYDIVALIGTGGMGEVYRARDTSLGRDVALKFLPQEFARDPDRLARFQREARALASLNHPNTAAIHAFERSDDIPYLVLEYVPGKTLHGPIPIRNAVAIARQICEGLEAAHRQGFIHRDLKPANIKITPEGTVKILDFGLAKAFISTSDADNATLTIDSTKTGLIRGTAAYMSPEQAQGQPVDNRTDVWAFGCVLYELLSGRAPFRRETMSDTIQAVLSREPDWDALPADTPDSIRRLLRRCLQKDADQRLHHIADARIELQESEDYRPQKQTSGWRRQLIPWLTAAVIAGSAIAVSVSHFGKQAAVQSVTLSLLPPEKWLFDSFAVSPDGRLLAFTALNSQSEAQLWVRSLDSPSAKPLVGTEGAMQPFWSPDGKSLGFFTQGKLKKIDVAGGPPQTVCDAPGAAGAWNSDGVIIFAPGDSNPLHRVRATGGMPELLIPLDRSRHEQGHGAPRFLPDGRRFLYSSRAWAAGKQAHGGYVASLDDRTPKHVISDASHPVFIDSAGGHLVFVREGLLLAQRFNLSRLEVQGDSTVIGKVGINFRRAAGAWTFSVSENGVMVYKSENTGITQLTWFDRYGNRVGTLDQPDFRYNLAISPDGKRVATERRDPSGNYDIWILDLLRGTSSRLTSHPAPDGMPAWSPDGNRIVFFSTRTGVAQIYHAASSGFGNDELLLRSEFGQIPSEWSRDGRFIVYREDHPVTGMDLWLIAVDGEKRATPVVRTRFNEDRGHLSPDSKWIAYQSNEFGRREVYVQAVPGGHGEASTSSRRWQVSTRGGDEPRWRGDGRELYYLSLDGRLMAAEVRTSESSFDISVPKALFEVHAIGFNRYDVTRDGRRFLMNIPVESGSSDAATVVLNWASALKK